MALALIAFLALDAYQAPSTYYEATVRHALSVWGLTMSEFDSPFERLSFLYAAEQFRRFMFENSAASMLHTSQAYWDYLNRSFALPAVGLMLLGATTLLLRRTREGVFLWLVWLTQFVFVTNYDVGYIKIFYIPSFVILAVFISVGSATALDLFVRLAQGVRAPAPATTNAGSAAGLLLLVGLSAPFTSTIREAWGAGRATFIAEGDFADYHYPVGNPERPREAALALVRAVEDDAIVFTDWGMLYACYFVAHVEQGRTRVAFRETYPQTGVRRLAESTLEYIEANIDTRPVYFSDRPSSLEAKFRMTRTASGLFRIERK